MKTKARLLIMLSTYFWSVIGFMLTGSFWFFLIFSGAIAYAIAGGKKHA
ncbi:MAG: hypothetical protein IH571_02930 [Acholeplasmataceae bacterium]|nr:hypothetical protein [Acholeplasmataceae bacterium]